MSLKSAVSETLVGMKKYVDLGGAVMIPIPFVSLCLALIQSWEVTSSEVLHLFSPSRWMRLQFFSLVDMVRTVRSLQCNVLSYRLLFT